MKDISSAPPRSRPARALPRFRRLVRRFRPALRTRSRCKPETHRRSWTICFAGSGARSRSCPAGASPISTAISRRSTCPPPACTARSSGPRPSELQRKLRSPSRARRRRAAGWPRSHSGRTTASMSRTRAARSCCISAQHPEQAPRAERLAEQRGRAVSTRLDASPATRSSRSAQRDVTKANARPALHAPAALRGRVPVFVGDDVTDEDGLREAAARRRVRREGRPGNLARVPPAESQRFMPGLAGSCDTTLAGGNR